MFGRVLDIHQRIDAVAGNQGADQYIQQQDDSDIHDSSPQIFGAWFITTGAATKDVDVVQFDAGFSRVASNALLNVLVATETGLRRWRGERSPGNSD